MRHTLLPALTLLALVACAQAPVAPSPDTDENMQAVMEGTSSSEAPMSGPVMMSLEQSITTDENGIPHNKASLILTGVINRSIDLGDVQGELQLVDPAAYARYTVANGETIAAFSTWFAGQGEEIWVTRYNDPQALTVEHRYGDEGGICNPPGLIADIPLAREVTVDFDASGLETIDRSSIDFPCTAP